MMANLRSQLGVMFDDAERPLEGLWACGHLKEVMREREVHLVRQSRAEGATWEQVGEALGYDAELMELLWGARR